MSRKRLLRLALALTCGAAIALAGAPGAQAAPGSHQPLFTIFFFPTRLGSYFEDACGVAVRPDGGIYVSDYYNDKVESFDSSGAYLSEAQSLDPADGACGLAALTNTELAASSFHLDAFGYSYPGSELWSVRSSEEGPSESTGVAYDPATGYLYVDDRSYIAVYGTSGSPPEPGAEVMRVGVGSLGDGYGVAVSEHPGSEGFVYVPDAATATIKVYDPSTSLTTPVASFDGRGTPTEGFTTLRDASVAIDDSTGDLFVVYNAQGPFYEHPKAALAEFNPAGEYRGTVPAPLRFGEPSGIAVDNTGSSTQGRVYVTSGNSEVESRAKPCPPTSSPEACHRQSPANPSEPLLGRPEEGAVLAFSPTAPGQLLEARLAGSGTGTVQSEPAGIACPGACAAEYDAGSEVELTAQAAAGSVFAGWSGACSGTAACTVTMNSDAEAIARFEPAPAAAIAAAGAGPATVGASIPRAGVASVSAPPVATVAHSASAQRSVARHRARRRRLHARLKHRRHHRHAARRAGHRRARKWGRRR